MQRGKGAELKFAKAMWGMVVVAVAVVVAGLGAVAVFFAELEPAAMSYRVRGVDVSAHNGAIDWQKLKADDIAFAFIKATEGGDFVDAEFSANWRAADKAGMPRGAYHFFTQCRSGLAQAQHFLATVPRDPNALPPVVDAEHMGPCRQGPAVKDIAAELEVFLDEVELRLGKRPIIYTTQQFHDAYLTGLFPNERFWVRSLFFAPAFRQDQWLFWQYHNKGTRDGAAGPIDLNAFNGTEAELLALTN